MRHAVVENMPADAAAGEPVGAPVLMDAALRPNRSLPNRGYLAVMAFLTASSMIAAMLFARLGAWPVVGFIGLVLVLIVVAFQVSYKSGRLVERVVVTPGRLHVTRRDPAGRETKWRVQTAWVRVLLDKPVRHDSQIQVADRGRVLVLGAFLSPAERGAFADALRAALDRANQGDTSDRAGSGHERAPAQDSGGAPTD